jgi:hypothetical protein
MSPHLRETQKNARTAISRADVVVLSAAARSLRAPSKRLCPDSGQAIAARAGSCKLDAASAAVFGVVLTD